MKPDSLESEVVRAGHSASAYFSCEDGVNAAVCGTRFELLPIGVL